MAAFNVPYIVGDTFKRDHPMWPTILRSEIELRTGITDPVVIDRTWPVDINLQQMMSLSWRVKNWTIEATANASFRVTDTISSTTEDYVLSTDLSPALLYVYNGTTNNIATREIDVVSFDFGAPYHPLGNAGIHVDFGSPMVSIWSIVANAGPPFGGVTNLFGTDPILFFQNFYALFDDVTKVFSPSVSFDGFIIGGPDTVAPAFLGLQGAKNPQTVSSGTVNPLRAPGSASIVSGISDDFVIPFEIQYGIPFLTPSLVYSAGTATCEFTITANEFWTYSNRLGQAIYDSSTGAPTGANPNA